jgi:hypothetical protein
VVKPGKSPAPSTNLAADYTLSPSEKRGAQTFEANQHKMIQDGNRSLCLWASPAVKVHFGEESPSCNSFIMRILRRTLSPSGLCKELAQVTSIKSIG